MLVHCACFVTSFLVSRIFILNALKSERAVTVSEQSYASPFPLQRATAYISNFEHILLGYKLAWPLRAAMIAIFCRLLFRSLLCLCTFGPMIIAVYLFYRDPQFAVIRGPGNLPAGSSNSIVARGRERRRARPPPKATPKSLAAKKTARATAAAVAADANRRPKAAPDDFRRRQLEESTVLSPPPGPSSLFQHGAGAGGGRGTAPAAAAAAAPAAPTPRRIPFSDVKKSQQKMKKGSSSLSEHNDENKESAVERTSVLNEKAPVEEKTAAIKNGPKEAPQQKNYAEQNQGQSTQKRKKAPQEGALHHKPSSKSRKSGMDTTPMEEEEVVPSSSCSSRKVGKEKAGDNLSPSKPIKARKITTAGSLQATQEKPMECDVQVKKRPGAELVIGEPGNASKRGKPERASLPIQQPRLKPLSSLRRGNPSANGGPSAPPPPGRLPLRQKRTIPSYEMERNCLEFQEELAREEKQAQLNVINMLARAHDVATGTVSLKKSKLSSTSGQSGSTNNSETKEKKPSAARGFTFGSNTSQSGGKEADLSSSKPSGFTLNAPSSTADKTTEQSGDKTAFTFGATIAAPSNPEEKQKEPSTSKPGVAASGFTFGVTPAPAPAADADGPLTAANSSKPAGGFTFGASATPAPTPAAAAEATASAFGGAKDPVPPKPAAGFTFGASVPAPTPAPGTASDNSGVATSKPGGSKLSFGSSSATTSAPAPPASTLVDPPRKEGGGFTFGSSASVSGAGTKSAAPGGFAFGAAGSQGAVTEATPKPAVGGGFAFGSAEAKAAAEAKTSSTIPVGSGFSFGSGAAAATTTKAPPTTGGFAFGGAAGSAPDLPQAPGPTTFAFGGNPPPPPPALAKASEGGAGPAPLDQQPAAGSNKSAFVFGPAPGQSALGAGQSAKPTLAFGAGEKKDAAQSAGLENKPGASFAFGTASKEQTISTALVFGSPTPETKPPRGAGFAQQSTANPFAGAGVSSTPFGGGSNARADKPAAPVFGQGAAAAAPSPAFAFGQQVSAAVAPSTFGQPSATPAKAGGGAAATFAFGQAGMAASPAPTFGGTAAAPSPFGGASGGAGGFGAPSASPFGVPGASPIPSSGGGGGGGGSAAGFALGGTQTNKPRRKIVRSKKR